MRCAHPEEGEETLGRPDGGVVFLHKRPRREGPRRSPAPAAEDLRPDASVPLRRDAIARAPETREEAERCRAGLLEEAKGENTPERLQGQEGSWALCQKSDEAERLFEEAKAENTPETLQGEGRKSGKGQGSEGQKSTVPTSVVPMARIATAQAINV